MHPADSGAVKRESSMPRRSETRKRHSRPRSAEPVKASITYRQRSRTWTRPERITSRTRCAICVCKTR